VFSLNRIRYYVPLRCAFPDLRNDVPVRGGCYLQMAVMMYHNALCFHQIAEMMCFCAVPPDRLNDVLLRGALNLFAEMMYFSAVLCPDRCNYVSLRGALNQIA